MGTPSDHLARAAENEKLAEELAAAGNFRWASVLTFYAALHHLCALLAEFQSVATDPLRHRSLQQKIDEHHRPIAARYMALFGESHRCRYIAHHVADKDSYRRQAQHLKVIKDHCDSVRSSGAL